VGTLLTMTGMGSRRLNRGDTGNGRETEATPGLWLVWLEWLLTEVGEDGEDTAVSVVTIGYAELHQHVAHVGFNGPLAQVETLADTGVG
jgi:hypothetical protein